MKVCKVFYFDAAHYLPEHTGNCKHLHGHTYKLEIVVEDTVKPDGMVIDFSMIKSIVDKEIIQKLDHQQLNDILKIPTAEHIVTWIAKQLETKLPLSSIRLWEGEGKWVQLTVKE